MAENLLTVLYGWEGQYLVGRRGQPSQRTDVGEFANEQQMPNKLYDRMQNNRYICTRIKTILWKK